MLRGMGVYAARGNSSRVYLHRFLERAGQTVEAGQLVLDAGAGRAPYRDLFAHARYETADFLAVKGKKYVTPDYVCDLAEIPVEDARFDHVLLTQVLEHIPEPARVVAELHRVLKPGGTLWLTAPLFYAEHERPYDFFRYTQFGLRHLLESAGFEVLELDWMEGYLGTLSYQARLMGRSLPSSPRGLRRRPHGHRAGVRREAVQAHRAACRRRARETRPEVQARRPRAAEELSGQSPGSDRSIHCCAMSRQRADLVKLVRRARRRAARWLAPEYEQELRETQRKLRTARGRLRKARAELDATREHSPLFEGEMPERVARTVAAVRDERLTYLKPAMLEDLAACVLQIEHDGIDGLVIEAGAARGGSAIVLAAAKAPERPMKLYDVFGMIPPPTEQDGPDVHRRYETIRSGEAKGPGGETYYGYRDDLYHEVHDAFTRHGFALGESQRRPRPGPVRGHDPPRRPGRPRPSRRGLVRVDPDVPDPDRAAARRRRADRARRLLQVVGLPDAPSTSTSPAARPTRRAPHEAPPRP